MLVADISHTAVKAAQHPRKARLRGAWGASAAALFAKGRK